MRIVVLDDWERIAVDALGRGSLGPDAEMTVLTEPLSGSDAVRAAASGADVLVVMRERTALSAELIDGLSGLRLIVTTGAANAAIDLEACRRRGIRVCGTTSYPGGAAEMTWALILAAARRLDRVLPDMRAGGWDSSAGMALHGRTLGLIGFGRVGSQVARVGAAFGMDVVAWSPTLSSERAAAEGARAAALDEVAREADVLSLHSALNAETAGLVDERLLQRMRASAWLINTARAGLIDTDALLRALDEGNLSGAALDVHEAEPLPADSRLRVHPRIITTPHLGYVTDRALAHWYADVAEAIRAWSAGTPIRIIV